MREFSEKINNYLLGESAGKIELDTLSDNRDVVCAMAAQARHQILIFTWNLDPGIYDDPLFLEAVKQMVTTSPFATVRVLLQNNEYVVKNGHRLIELMRRLTSKIEIRKPNADYLKHPENMMIVDQTGYVHRELATSFEGFADFYAPLTVKRYLEFFNLVWDKSQPDDELRRLHL